jgi:hypothetical protein
LPQGMLSGSLVAGVKNLSSRDRDKPLPPPPKQG